MGYTAGVAYRVWLGGAGDADFNVNVNETTTVPSRLRLILAGAAKKLRGTQGNQKL